MFIEFRLKNFRAFRHETVFSLAASADKAMSVTNSVPTGIRAVPRALRVAAIYGPNAGGKSTLFMAINLMRGVVVESASLKPDQLFNVQPFRLDAACLEEPTLFEATFVINGIRYQYGFEFKPHRIVSEWLLVYEKSKPQQWFSRKYSSENNEEHFSFGPRLRGQKHVWQGATRPNALFLSTAIQLNSEHLQPIFQWFSSSLNIALNGGILPPDYSIQMFDQNRGASISHILKAADIGISDISLEKKKSKRHEMQLDFATGQVKSNASEGDVLVPKFRHRLAGFEVDFDFGDESQGTQKLFSLAGPILNIIENGHVLLVDELDGSLHPLLVRRLVEMFQDPAVNTKGAQLVFSTHDSSLLDHTLFRRDQIWFAEKDKDQAASLSPLSSFSPRKNEAFERGYLTGRYGGIPILGDRLLPVRSNA